MKIKTPLLIILLSLFCCVYFSMMFDAIRYALTCNNKILSLFVVSIIVFICVAALVVFTDVVKMKEDE